MKILIVKLGAVGDVLRTTSILKGLKEKHKDAAIDWITSKSGKEILSNNPYIDCIYTWEEKDQLGQYDLVIGLEDDLEACQLVSSLKPKKILGAYVENGKITYTPSAWFDMSAISKFGLEKANKLKAENKKTFQQHMGDLLGVRVGEYVFELSDDEVEYGERVIRRLGDQVIGVNTGAGKRWQLKSLSVAKTIELIKKLNKPCIILGGEEEQERNEEISKATGMPVSGAHSLRNFAGIINACFAIITSDSLAMHFAIASKKPLVVFFGPTSHTEIELYGLGKKVYPDMDCLSCYKKVCDKKPNCVELMPVDELFNAVFFLLNRILKI